MKYRVSLYPGLLLLTLGLGFQPARADEDCDARLSLWQSRDAVRQMAAAQGWQIQRLKIDDGCYEIRGTDAKGRAFKAKLDPQTLKVLKMKPDDRQRSRERDHDDFPQQAQPLPPSSSAASSPLSTPGSAPRGQIQ